MPSPRPTRLETMVCEPHLAVMSPRFAAPLRRSFSGKAGRIYGRIWTPLVGRIPFWGVSLCFEVRPKLARSFEGSFFFRPKKPLRLPRPRESAERERERHQAVRLESAPLRERKSARVEDEDEDEALAEGKVGRATTTTTTDAALFGVGV